MEDMISAVIIGSGAMGKIHGEILRANPRTEIKYVIDKDKEKAKELANYLGAGILEDIKQINSEEIDIAFVCVPNDLHAQVSIEALNQGIHVFCEKPMATTVCDAERMIEAANKVGRRLFVGHNRRFAPVYMKTKETVSRSEYLPHSMNIIQNDGDMGGEGSLWAANFEHLGGFLFDTTIHFLDMAEYLMGEIKDISAFSKSACYPVDDDSVVKFRCEGDRIGVISSCGHASWIFPFERVQIVGDHKSVITEELDLYRFAPGLSETILCEDYSKLPFNEKWGYVKMHDHILDSIITNTEALNESHVGLRAVKLVEACYESIRNNGDLINI